MLDLILLAAVSAALVLVERSVDVIDKDDRIMVTD